MHSRFIIPALMAALSLAPADAAEFVLLEDNQPARAFVPSVANGGATLGSSWTDPGFDDSTWLAGTTGMGYDADTGSGGDYRPLARIGVAAMHTVNASAFLRVPFTVEEATRAQLRRLTLELKFDDGFVAYLNGTKVAAVLEPASLAWNSATLDNQTHDANPTLAHEEFDLSTHLELVREGANLLAIHGLNSSIGSSDLLIAPRITAADRPPLVWPEGHVIDTGGGSLDFPVAVRNAGDGSGRLFVVERRGRIKVLHNGVISTFLDLSDRVLSSADPLDERGLLGLALPPGFGSTRLHFYVSYTGNAPPNAGDAVVSRFFLTTPRPPGAVVDTADPTSERLVLQIDDPYADQNGGDLHFGRDGYLYLGLGDGGNFNDPGNRAQDPASLWGKILRLDVESGPPETSTYAVPPDNPFVGQPGVLGEIWHAGLHNPWRWSFDRETGAMFIGDVGQAVIEEINYAPPNSGPLNFGWRRRWARARSEWTKPCRGRPPVQFVTARK